MLYLLYSLPYPDYKSVYVYIYVCVYVYVYIDIYFYNIKIYKNIICVNICVYRHIYCLLLLLSLRLIFPNTTVLVIKKQLCVFKIEC